MNKYLAKLFFNYKANYTLNKLSVVKNQNRPTIKKKERGKI